MLGADEPIERAAVPELLLAGVLGVGLLTVVGAGEPMDLAAFPELVVAGAVVGGV